MQLRYVLIADDSKVFRACERELMLDYGFGVFEAENGRQALELAIQHQPDLLFLDALMPALSGFEVLTKLHERLPDYHPIVFLATAVYKSRRWESEARQQYGVHEYLEKPLEDDTLVAALRRQFPDLVKVRP
jgi:putative two-component system response regulator